MSTTTFPVSGSFGGRRSQPVLRATKPRTTTPARVFTAPKRASWLGFFGNAFAAWASAGRVPTGL